ncbi:hypothetical protein CCMA1212_007903 [Trichoderma ghanense]|uniref:Uncharacterized protein n=1 Tax=Trichoderma ghanense TaxID=65468 RepID=A0ABY2GX25_9HYPO
MDYRYFSGTVHTLHALRLDPTVLGSRTIPPTARLSREIRISPTSPIMQVHETAAVGDDDDDDEMFVFFLRCPSEHFGYLFSELRQPDSEDVRVVASYLNLIRGAMDDPRVFMTFRGITTLKWEENMIASIVRRGDFEGNSV